MRLYFSTLCCLHILQWLYYRSKIFSVQFICIWKIFSRSFYDITRNIYIFPCSKIHICVRASIANDLICYGNKLLKIYVLVFLVDRITISMATNRRLHFVRTKWKIIIFIIKMRLIKVIETPEWFGVNHAKITRICTTKLTVVRFFTKKLSSKGRKIEY